MAEPQVIDEHNLLRQLKGLPGGKRHLVAIAGAPGAGKSTLSARLCAAINVETPGRTAILPMDGFHYDDAVLKERGRYERKGAPDTFDVDGLQHMLRRLRTNDRDEVAIPLFDRKIEVTRAGAGIIPRSAGIILVEGNYLLVDEAPWDVLRDAFDVRVLIRVGDTEIHRRLTARWRHYGLSPDETHRKLEDNDLPNGSYVMARSAMPDFILSGDAS